MKISYVLHAAMGATCFCAIFLSRPPDLKHDDRLRWVEAGDGCNDDDLFTR